MIKIKKIWLQKWKGCIKMRRIIIFNLIGFSLVLGWIMTFKFLGYNDSLFLGQPIQYLLIVLPIGIIFYLFHLFFTIFYKPKDLIEKILKYSTLILLHFIYALWFTIPWFYIKVGTGLQVFVEVFIMTTIVIITSFQIWREFIWMKNKVKTNKK